MTDIPTGRLLRGILMDGQARVLMCDTTAMAEEARRIHRASNVCAAALGRGISAAALLMAAFEEESNSITMTFKGNGPAGAMVVVAHGKKIKAYLDHPDVQVPLREDRKLDVGGVIGKTGRLTVIRDLGLKEPYIGHCDLVSGEIAEDVAAYCARSEQQPSLCALGVLINDDAVLSSGGMIVQPMPGCSDEVLDALELRSPILSDISAHLLEYRVEEFFQSFCAGLSPKILSQETLLYACDCSREKMERVLVSLGADELNDIVQKNHKAEITCNFCCKQHQFTEEELKLLIMRA